MSYEGFIAWMHSTSYEGFIACDVTGHFGQQLQEQRLHMGHEGERG